MEDLFFARLDDLRGRADRGGISCTAFLNESEGAEARRYLESLGERRFIFWGGYDGAQRTRLFLFPDWCPPDPAAAEEYIAPVCISGSGYRELDHRAYLGALTSAGLSRDVIGDIVVENESSAVVFLDARIADYLLTSPDALDRVSSDKVRVTRYVLPTGFSRKEKLSGINVTLASPRLDCVLSALIRTSREKAKSLILEGLVQCDHVVCRDPDRAVGDGCVVSVRGYGRFRVDNIGGKTKKDRLRMFAVKYV